MIPTSFPDHVPAFGKLVVKGYLVNQAKEEMKNFICPPSEYLGREARAQGG